MLRLADSVRFRRVLDEGVMLRLDTGEILGLNGVGARVVELLADGERGRADIVEILRSELRTGDAEVAHDVDRFVAELEEAGVLVEEAPTDAVADAGVEP